ncbi:MAG: dihydroxy-acid dehydratase, partial [Pseudomonadota bacterium]
ATGGSTNHTIHLVAIAAAAGIQVDWQDFSELSGVVPQLARVYPNGVADVNHFHAAGGLGLVMHELLNNGLLHDDVETILGHGLSAYSAEPKLEGGKLVWHDAPSKSLDTDIVRPCSDAFADEGGLQLVEGNLGRAIVKVSAVDPQHHAIKAPAIVFTSQKEFVDAFNNDELERDFVAVVTGQGPRANGMPELHKLTPYLGVLQNRGFKVALLTDGRMSGASGKVLAAIQVTPEAACDGAIGLLQDGDVIEIDAANGVMQIDADLDGRARNYTPAPQFGLGRELFGAFRDRAGSAESGASLFDTI